jgi:hypothetical protein
MKLKMQSMEKPKELTITKIPLKSFVDVLIGLYNKGVDYIDMVVTPGEVQDNLEISFTKEYMTKETITLEEEEPTLNNDLSEEDLTQLI